ncbi:hypothetical protein H3Z83_12535 [Tenacibaculum sp. S7007]|uniref:Uncharacterized protein n=1 Tax=Tenacibaculum pelagium TaxID=2759527 RepID=A0A839ARP3_9FLAO|nr:hypothetical protein [Tenacibaculum pelagium]MBA6157337.1 hypothetical protein [Tenacibaculum pelagium]
MILGLNRKIFGSIIFLLLVILYTHLTLPKPKILDEVNIFSIELILKHSQIILTIPLLIFGFYEVAKMLMDKKRFSLLAFIIIVLGLLVKMFNSIITGLIFPHFVKRNSGKISEVNLDILLMNYMDNLNVFSSYIFIITCFIAISIWLLLIIKHKLN